MILLQASTLINPKLDAVLEILLVLSLATVLGWFLARLVYAGRINGLNDRIADKQAQLEECRRSKGEVFDEPETVLETPMHIESPSGIPGITSATEAPIWEVPNPNLRATPTSLTPDDLKIVEGIGPKIEALLNHDGILTFAQLAAASPERLHQVLVAAGPRFQIAHPGTWPQQAQLAAHGKWSELKKLQDELTAGRS
ncbi:MAG: hypothetical protein LH606_20880 [Cytophagaceae bacterium]|nr:hypothetical protein [Cytophagaceae bacterium]